MTMNILILGLGSIGRRHAKILRQYWPEHKVFALRSGTGWGPEEGVTDIHSIAEIPDKLDLCIISSPTDLHLAQVKSIARFHPFLFIEKPLALTVASGKELVDVVQDAEMRSYVGCHLRFLPALRSLHDAVAQYSRAIASVTSTCKSWMPDWQPGRDYKTSFRADRVRSGGVHLELIHELDYVTWILGAPLRRSVTLGCNPILGITAYSEAHYDLFYANFSATIDLSYSSKIKERILNITYEDGTSSIINVFVPPEELHEVFVAQMRYVLDCVDRREQSDHSVEDALKTLILALP